MTTWRTGRINHEHILDGHLHSSGVNSVAFSCDGKRMFSGSGDVSVRIWNAITCRMEHVLYGHWDRVTSIACSYGGLRVVSG